MNLYTRDFIYTLKQNEEIEIDLNTFVDQIGTSKDYALLCEFIENYILDDYSRARDEVILHGSKKDIRRITLFQFLYNLYFLEFNFVYNVPIDMTWFRDVDHKFFKNQNAQIELFMRYKVLPEVIKRGINQEDCFSNLLSNLVERMERLSELFSMISSPTINIVDLMEFCKRNKIFDELIHTELDGSKTSVELERVLDKRGTLMYNTVLKDRRSCLYPFVASGDASQRQITQMFVAVGPRMSASNVIMDHVMTCSYLRNLQNVGDFIAESELATKALIYKKKFVGVSGYMSRETNIAGINLEVDYSRKDCGTKHYINFEIKTPKHFDLVINRNMIMPDGKLKVITEKDTHLIGDIVQLRSILTCAHTKPGKVCKTCYGNPMDFKEPYMIGGATSTEIINKLSNAVMAVKHHNASKTTEFADEEMLKIFELDETSLVLKKLSNPENITIQFDKEYIEDIKTRIADQDFDNDLDDDEEDDEEFDEELESMRVSRKKLTKLSFVTTSIDPLTREEIKTEYTPEIDSALLLLSSEMLAVENLEKIHLLQDSELAELNLADLKPGTTVFSIKYLTAETAKYLKQLKQIIDRPMADWYHNNLSTPLQDFADLIVEVGLKDEELIFMEPILHASTRNPRDITLRPDFRKDKVDTVLVNFRQAIFKGDICSALIYQEISKTFKDIDNYNKPEIGPGIHDCSFRTTIKNDFTYMKKALKKAKVI